MKRNVITLVCFLCFEVILACHTKTKQAQSSEHHTSAAVPVPPPDLNGFWLLEQVNEHAVHEDSTDRERPYIEIREKDGLYFGYSGCNRMNGAFVLDNQSITFKPGPMTQRACVDDRNVEREFLKALFSATYYTFADNKLELRDEVNKVVCRFRRMNE
jgi:heat shock protein HslJ